VKTRFLILRIIDIQRISRGGENYHTLETVIKNPSLPEGTIEVSEKAN
tara:strand:- start:2028 stop:2171 length:144 start_codon:yes stop_codon:yes gene_type:complete